MIDLDNLNDIYEWYANFLKPLKRLTQEKKDCLVKKLKERVEEARKILENTQSFKTPSCKLGNSDLVYNALKKNPRQTKEEVSIATGLSRATITRTYKQLEELHKIKRVGSNKTGYWEIL